MACSTVQNTSMLGIYNCNTAQRTADPWRGAGASKGGDRQNSKDHSLHRESVCYSGSQHVSLSVNVDALRGKDSQQLWVKFKMISFFCMPLKADVIGTGALPYTHGRVQSIFTLLPSGVPHDVQHGWSMPSTPFLFLKNWQGGCSSKSRKKTMGKGTLALRMVTPGSFSHTNQCCAWKQPAALSNCNRASLGFLPCCIITDVHARVNYEAWSECRIYEQNGWCTLLELDCAVHC